MKLKNNVQNIILKIQIDEQFLFVEETENSFKTFIQFDDEPVLLFEGNTLNDAVAFTLKHCVKMFNFTINSN